MTGRVGVIARLLCMQSVHDILGKQPSANSLASMVLGGASLHEEGCLSVLHPQHRMCGTVNG